MFRYLFLFAVCIASSCQAAFEFRVVSPALTARPGQTVTFSLQVASTTPNETLNSYSASWFNNAAQITISPEPATGTPGVSVGGGFQTLQSVSVTLAPTVSDGTVVPAVGGTILANGVAAAWQNGTGGNFTVTAVPEPGSMLLLGIAGTGICYRRLRKRRDPAKVEDSV